MTSKLVEISSKILLARKHSMCNQMLFDSGKKPIDFSDFYVYIFRIIDSEQTLKFTSDFFYYLNVNEMLRCFNRLYVCLMNGVFWRNTAWPRTEGTEYLININICWYKHLHFSFTNYTCAPGGTHLGNQLAEKTGADWLTDWHPDWLTDILIDWLTDWRLLTAWQTVWLNWLNGQVTDWLTDWLTEWLTDWLTEWLTE